MYTLFIHNGGIVFIWFIIFFLIINYQCFSIMFNSYQFFMVLCVCVCVCVCVYARMLSCV